MRFNKLILLTLPLIITSCSGNNLEPSIEPSISPSVEPRENIEIKCHKNDDLLLNYIVNKLNESDIPYTYSLKKVSYQEKEDLSISNTLGYQNTYSFSDDLKETVKNVVGEEYINLFLKDDKLIGVPFGFYSSSMFIDTNVFTRYESYQSLIENAIENSRHVVAHPYSVENYLMSSTMFGERVFYIEDGVYKSDIALSSSDDLLSKLYEFFHQEGMNYYSTDTATYLYDATLLPNDFYGHVAYDNPEASIKLINALDIIIDNNAYKANGRASFEYVTKDPDSQIKDEALEFFLKEFINYDTQLYIASTKRVNYLPIINDVYHQESTKEDIKDIDFKFSDYENYSYKFTGNDHIAFTMFLGDVSNRILGTMGPNNISQRAQEILDELNNEYH